MAATSSSRSSPASTSAAAKDLAAQLAASQSTTIYVDADLNDADAAALLQADPPLHVEYDAVRDKWAIRAASPDEVVSEPVPASEPASK